MTICQQLYARAGGIEHTLPGHTVFQFTASGRANIQQRTGTKREMHEIWSIVLRNKSPLDVNHVEEESRTQVENLRKATE